MVSLNRAEPLPSADTLRLVRADAEKEERAVAAGVSPFERRTDPLVGDAAATATDGLECCAFIEGLNRTDAVADLTGEDGAFERPGRVRNKNVSLISAKRHK